MKQSAKQLADHIENWLTTGTIHSDILSPFFQFSSPFWKNANKEQFLNKFKDPQEYIDTSLSKIKYFEPIKQYFSIGENDCHSGFSIALRYHTKNGSSVDEVVVCTVKNEQIDSMLSIYDLNTTKHALEL